LAIGDRFAEQAGVPPDAVTVTAEAGSVVLSVTLVSPNATAAVAVAQSVAAVVESPAAASSFLADVGGVGVQVEAIEAPPAVTVLETAGDLESGGTPLAVPGIGLDPPTIAASVVLGCVGLAFLCLGVRLARRWNRAEPAAGKQPAGISSSSSEPPLKLASAPTAPENRSFHHNRLREARNVWSQSIRDVRQKLPGASNSTGTRLSAHKLPPPNLPKKQSQAQGLSAEVVRQRL
jgi:hypothetical protein